MIVTRFHYPLEERLIKRIDLMIKRVMQRNPKRDAVLLIEGPESEGKTTLSAALGYYISEKTGREFSNSNVFFDVQKMIEFLQNTDEQIAIWDEPALVALTGDWNKRIIKDLTRLLMMCRKKRHFIIINMTYFNKFTDYIVWQRPLGMIHVYSRDEEHAGRFVYIRKKKLEKLWLDWHRKKQRNYKKYSSKRVRGTFPDVLNPDYKHNVLSEFDYDAYDDAKDKAIQSVGKEKETENTKLLKLQYRCSQLSKELKNRGIEQQEVTRLLKIADGTLNKWAKISQKYPKILEN